MPSARELGQQGIIADLDTVRSMWVKAVTGKPRANGSFTLKGDAASGDRLPGNKIYVRLDENPQEVLECWNANGIGMRVNTAVFIFKTRGEWRVQSLEDQGVDNTYGSNAPNLALPPVDSEAANFKLGGADYKPGSLVQSVASSLKVKVRPFFYRYFDSVKYHSGAEELDLTDYLPASSGTWAWVWVGVDPITETLTAKTGAEYGIKSQLTISDLVSIDMTGIIPSDAVPLQEGSTAFSIDNKIAFGRHLVELHSTVPSTVGTARVGAGNSYEFHDSVIFSGTFTIDGSIRIAA